MCRPAIDDVRDDPRHRLPLQALHLRWASWYLHPWDGEAAPGDLERDTAGTLIIVDRSLTLDFTTAVDPSGRAFPSPTGIHN